MLLIASCTLMHEQKATVRFDAQTKYQHITGFGGFVCSPQFTYNHMTSAEIKKVWGSSSTVGCNIMRLYIPIGKNAWSQSLATAKQAKQMGLIVFASPWGQPKEWKTNNSSDAKTSDDSNVLQFSSDAACTSIDMTAVTNLPATLPWLENSNQVVYVSADAPLTGNNVVKDGTCASLVINESWGAFRPATSFTATTATYTCTVDGSHIVQLPFESTVPEGAVVYTLTADLLPVAVSGVVPANQPLLVEAQGEVTFVGSGAVDYAPCPFSDDVLPIGTPTAIEPFTIHHSPSTIHHPQSTLNGQRVGRTYRGIVVEGGKKYLKK